MELKVTTDNLGVTRYFNEVGQLHRIGAPAIECANGAKHYYRQGKRHRLEGPAIILRSSSAWFIDDSELTEKDFNIVMNNKQGNA